MKAKGFVWVMRRSGDVMLVIFAKPTEYLVIENTGAVMGKKLWGKQCSILVARQEIQK